MPTNLSNQLSRLTPDQLATITFESGFNADLSLASNSFAAFQANQANKASPPPSPLATPQVDTVQTALQAGGTITYGFYSDLPIYQFSTLEMDNAVQALALWGDMANITFVYDPNPKTAQIDFIHSNDVLVGNTNGVVNKTTIAPGTLFDATGATATATTGLDQTTSGLIDLDNNKYKYNAQNIPTLDPTGSQLYGDFTSYTADGGYGIDTLVHEVGHLVGLGHTGPYNFNVNPALNVPAAPNQNNATDVRTWSIMSYIDPNATGAAMGQYAGTTDPQGESYTPADLDWVDSNNVMHTPYTPMGLDVIAAQRLLGAPGSSTTFHGNQTFGFHSTVRYTNYDGTTPLLSAYDFDPKDPGADTIPVVTIYDWGLNNTLDVSGFDSSTIDLNDGSWSSVAGLKKNIFIEWGTRIDNAVGGTGTNNFTVNAYSDSIVGDSGAINSVTLSQDRLAYVFDRSLNEITLHDTLSANGETDTLTNFQTFTFADGTYTAAQLGAITFVGGDPKGTTHFDKADNWDLGVIPTAAYDLTIPAGFSVEVVQTATNTVDSFQIANTATMDITVGHFIVNDAGATSDNSGVVTVGDDAQDNAILFVDGSFDNAGVLTILGNAALATDGDTTTFMGGGTIVMQAGAIGGSTAATLDTFINVDNTIEGSGEIGGGDIEFINYPFHFINQGTVEANGISSLTLWGGMTNTGELLASGASLFIDGTVTNAGGLIDSDGAASLVELDGGGVAGGTLEATNGGSLDVSRSATLDGTSAPVTLSGDLVVPSGQTLTVTGTVEGGGTIDATAGYVILSSAMNSGVQVLGGAGHIFYKGNGNVITGSGSGLESGLPVAAGQVITLSDAGGGSFSNPLSITLNGTGSGNSAKGALLSLTGSASFSGGGKITLGNPADRIASTGAFASLENVDNTISGTGIISGLYSFSNDGSGTVDAKGGPLIISAGSITNAGLMEAAADGTLDLLGNLYSYGGTLEGPGTIALGGSLDGTGMMGGLNGVTLAAGSVVDVDAPGASVSMAENDGTIVVQGDATLTIADTLDNTGTLVLDGFTDKSDHFATLAGTTGGFSGAQLGGGGIVMLGADGVLNTGTLANIDNTIEGDGQIGSAGYEFENTFAGGPGGTVEADVSGQALRVNGSGATMYNGSLMEATGGGTLEISGELQNFVTIDFSDPVERNGAGVLRAVGAGSVVLLNGATIVEGGLDSTTGGVVEVQGHTTLLVGGGLVIEPSEAPPYARASAFTTSADMRIASGATLSVATDNGQEEPTNTQLLNNYGTITVDGSLVAAMPYLDLASGGTVVLDGATAAISGASLSDTLINYDTITGFGELGAAGVQITNDVLVEATNPAAPLVVNAAGVFANNGVLANKGGVLTLIGTIAAGGYGIGRLANMGDGSIELGGLDHDGFAVPGDLLGGGILSGAVVKVGAAGATLDSTNVIGGNPVYVQNNGTVQVPAGLSLTVVGTLENAGEYDLTTNSFKTSTIDLQGANSSMILAGGTVTLQGYGGQVLMDNASTRIDGPAGQMLVNDSNTITGAGDIGFGDIGFNNGATDSVVDATGRIQIDTGAQAVGNAGTMEASTKAVLDVVSAVDNSGLISASVGALVIVGGAVTDTGTLGITGGAMTLDGGVASGQTVHFSGFLNETLALGSPLSMAGTIENFAFDETIDLVGIAATTLDFASGILHVRDGATEVAALAISGSHQSSDFKLTGDGGTGTDVVSEFAITNTPCFAAGTRLLGANGEIAVEALRPGDRLVTMDGARLAPVLWVGHTDIDLDRHPRAAGVAPVRVRADAFAPGVPHRDLLLSPDHAVYLDGVLIQIQALINGATIRREAAAGRVRYLHVELDRHAVVLAEGLPAESYLDTGNRGAFANGGAVCQLHSDFTGAQLWDGQACASLLLDGETVDDWHLRLARRATSLGHTLTDDPDVQVLSDGAMLPPTLQGPGYLTVIVPPGVTSVVLHSRSAVPAEIDRSSDRRRLGIALAAISLDGRALDGAGAAPGLHEVERDGPRSWRWTDGAATLRLPNCDHARELALSWHAGWQAYRIAATGAAPLEPVWHQKIG